MTHTEYVAGVCNIGPQETARRRTFGWIALAATLLFLVVLLWTGINSWWRLLLFFPATMSASGFLQAYFEFCSGFARRGVFNFGTPGQMEHIDDASSKAKDRRKGNHITCYAVSIGIAVAIVSVLM